MAAPEVELERMVVRIVGDNAPLSKAYQQSIGQTKEFGQQVVTAGKQAEQGFLPTESAVGRLGLSTQDARKMFHLLAMSSVLPPEAAMGAIQLSQGYGLVSNVVTRATAGMGALKLALVGTGVGAAVVGLGAAVAWLSHLSEEASKAREAAKQAFGTITSGSRTASQALSDVKVNVLTEGMQELADIVNPGFWRSIWNGLQGVVGLDPVQRRIDLIVQRSQAARDALITLNSDPRLREMNRNIAQERNVQAARDAATAMKEQADRAGLVEVESKKMEMSQRLSREAGISLAASNRMLANSFGEIAAAQQRIDLGKLQLQLRDLQDEAQRAGLPEIESRLVSMAQTFLRDNPAVGSMANAFSMLNPILMGTREALNQIKLGEFNLGVQDQIRTFNLSSERASLYRLRLQGVAEASIQAALANVRQLESLRALQAPLERNTAIRRGSAEADFARAEAAQRLQLLQRSDEIRQAPLAGATNQASLANSADAQYQRQQIELLTSIRNLIQRGAVQPGGGATAPVVIQPAGL